MPMKAEVWLQPIGNLALEGGRWSAPCSDRFAPSKDPLPMAQEAGWASGLVWTAQKISPPPEFDPWTFWPRVSCNTDCTIPSG
jgi:hypothetical protein